MKTHKIDVPAYHVWEFQQVLSESGIDYKRLERNSVDDPFTFEICGDDVKLALAETLLDSLDVYSSFVFASAENLEKTIQNVESYGLEVDNITVSSRILGKPRQYQLEVKGSEGGLNRLKLANLVSSTEQPLTVPPMAFVTTPLVFAASKGGSGKGTVAWFSHPGRTDDRSAI